MEPSPAQLCAGSWWCPTAWHRDPRKIPFGAPLPAGRSPPWRLDRAAPAAGIVAGASLSLVIFVGYLARTLALLGPNGHVVLLEPG